jgi:hypothetical protein
MSPNNARSDGVSFENIGRCEQRMSALAQSRHRQLRHPCPLWVKNQKKNPFTSKSTALPKADIKRRNALIQ